MRESEFNLSVDLPDLDHYEATRRVVEKLGEEGFGILTEIDVKKTLKKKLNVEYPRYVILGACKTPLAHRALAAEFDIGVCCCHATWSWPNARAAVPSSAPWIRLRPST